MGDGFTVVFSVLIWVPFCIFQLARLTYQLNGTRDKPVEWEPGRASWPFHFRRDGYRRFLAMFIVFYLVMLVALVGLAIIKLREPPFWASLYPVGSCVVQIGRSPDDLANEPTGPSELDGIECSKPHTHVASARVDQNAACPTGTDDEWTIVAQLKVCLRADTELRPGTPQGS